MLDNLICSLVTLNGNWGKMSTRAVFAAVNSGLKPIKNDLETIKGQLGQISDTVEDLARRIEEIEKLLKAEKKKAKVA